MSDQAQFVPFDVDGEISYIGEPSHPDAIVLWPIALPVYRVLLEAANAFGHDGLYREAVLMARAAEALRNQMMDSELGLRKATPEQHVAHAEKARSGHD